MSKKILGFIAVGLVTATLAVASTIPAHAGNNCGKISCADPVGVGKGNKVPMRFVSYCVVGKPGSWREIDCKSSKALNYTLGRRPYVCFVATDEKVHEDDQREVHIGRPFINHKAGGRWQPDWQDARPY